VTTADRPNYGNWVPRRIIMVLTILFFVSWILSVVIDIGIARGILAAVAVTSGALSVYMVYAHWLFGKNDGELQKQLCSALLERLDWDGRGKALDIGTGSGRAAINAAKTYPLAHCLGVDTWGKPWNYSKDTCHKNAEIEGVADRVSFQVASAVTLPFEDREYDAVISNFVFHSVRMVNKTALLREALRVLKQGGSFAFQDLFNKQFYGDMDNLRQELHSWGLREFALVDSSDYVHIPLALRVEHMAGNAKILYGIK
jgi:ubiquinone/menaquinone biosynthesis C-methylase UbiE